MDLPSDPDAVALAHQRAPALLHGSALQVARHPNDVRITNPRDPEKGTIYVDPIDGCVSWEQTRWVYWGAS
jgi:hypothetical protein